ncbi:hypothetical protein GE118_04280 [Mycoplasma sp. NEAQ87857]|uniref:MAG0480 family ComEC-like protein n=1 Tax=Mycoplasma sp. NEAQ87857 TaxID=2683967 RepID=UPI0013186B8D|nr:ComEC/Rec2 family competence protein [Mycoplasma sp. NEAQ87857]QGZ97993.1 hypothetical protein GE118_04280 [Mycoplasma sp. NEAQ87857]
MKKYFVNPKYGWYNISKIKQYFDYRLEYFNYFLIVCSFLFLFYKFNYLWLSLTFIPLILNLILFRNAWKIILISLIFCLIVIFINHQWNKINSKDINNSIFTVKDVSSKYLILQDNTFRNFVIFNKNYDLFLFDKILIQAKLKPIELNNYWESKNIFYELEIINLQKVSNWDFRNYLFRYLNALGISYNKFLIPLLFGYNFDSNNELITKLKDMGVIHLIVISGLHYYIIYKLIKIIFKKIDKYNLLSLFFITIYTFINKNTPSILKAFLMIITCEYIFFKQIKNNQINKIMLLFFVSLITLSINPKIVLNFGFWLSYLLTFSLLILNKTKYSRNKKLDNLIKLLIIWIIANILLLSFNTKFSIMSFIFNLLLSNLLELVLIISLLCLPFAIIVDVIYLNFNYLINILNNVNLIIVIDFTAYIFLLYPLVYFIILYNTILSKKLSI